MWFLEQAPAFSLGQERQVATVSGLQFLPPHQSDISVCRVAMWVGADGKWVLEYPNYTWHDVDARVFPLSLSPVSVSDARRAKYRERGYTEVHREAVCVLCGLSCTRMWRGGCRRLAPFHMEWWADDDPRAPVLLCGVPPALGVQSRSVHAAALVRRSRL